MLNLNILRELMKYDEVMVMKFLAIAQKQLPIQLTEILSFINLKEYDNISIAAHALKGMLGYLGATTTVNLAESLENAAENQADWELIMDIFSSLESSINTILVTINEMDLS